MNLFRYAAIGLAAITVSASAAEVVPVKFVCDAPWKKAAGQEQEFEIDYPGKSWPKVWAKFAAKADTFYRVTYEAKCSNPKQSLIPSGFVRYTGTLPCPNYTKYYAYFYSEKDNANGAVGFYMNPEPGAAKVSVRNVKVEALSKDDLKGNLFIFGEFEDGVAPQSMFINAWTQDFAVKIVDSPNFLSGTKSLMFPPNLKSGNDITSLDLPMIPGKKVEVKFWVKADSPTSVHSDVDCWTGGQKKHYYSQKFYRVTNEWQEITHTYTVPTLEMEPALKCHLLRLAFGRKGGPGNVYFDNISYTILD